jgi:glycosyltransferase involved in cell wall biosynthesis
MKNIAISLLHISPQNPTGVFTYVKNLLNNLDNPDKYYLLVKLKDYGYFKKKYKNVKVIDVRRNIKSLFARKNKPFKQKMLTKQIQKFIDKKHINTIFFPATYIYPLKNVKIITMICDLQHEYFPENFSPEHLKHRKNGYRDAVLNSDHIIAISNYTKKTIVEKYRVNADKITTIYLGANKINPKLIPLPENFIFYPAAFWPHKNHKILVEALNELKDEFSDLGLVFTGMIIKERVKKEINDLIEKYGLSKKVLFLGYVSDEQLSYVYQKAKALVFPSSFEGFGLPIVEAFKHELPIVAADNTSIAEIVGDAGLLFETNNLNMLVDCIKKVLTNHNLREQLVTKGLERVKNFSWKNTAQKTLSILERA